MKLCPVCAEERGSDYCPECGAECEDADACPECGSLNLEGSALCYACDAELE